MAKQLKVFFVASEVAPFAKTGGLADVAGALPKFLKEKGHDVRVIMPKYGLINERKYTLRDVIRLKDIEVAIGNRTVIGNVKSAFLPDTKVQVYFVDFPEYFDRKDLYVDPTTGKEFTDNPDRFVCFCKSVLRTLELLHWQPDVIHCNDWQTGLIPLYLRTVHKDDPFFQGVSTLISVHNLAYQGAYNADVLQKIGVPQDLFYEGSALEFYGKFNFLKAGIGYSDLISTVSETYAREIQEDEDLSAGLQDFLRSRSDDIFGIVNGIDYSVWDPSVDELIPAKYGPDDLEGKQENKRALVERMGMTYAPDIPVIGMISRLADQKGFDLIKDIIDDMMKLNMQFIVLGTGDEKYHKLLARIGKKYPGKTGINLTFDDPLAHLIEAGSDIFLMPSRYEPCGLNQLYSLRYGTVPVVRKTGGLADTIQDYDEEKGRGNGFVFEAYQSEELLGAVKRAVSVFDQKKAWRGIMSSGMKADYSWATSAKKYADLYAQLSSPRRKRGPR